MNFTFGKILTDTKTRLKIEVIHKQEVVGIHSFDKGRSTHSLKMNDELISDELIRELFAKTTMYANTKRNVRTV